MTTPEVDGAIRYYLSVSPCPREASRMARWMGLPIPRIRHRLRAMEARGELRRIRAGAKTTWMPRAV